MKKNLGVVQAVYPMPVLIVAAYDENGKVNAMNAAWGMICNEDRIALFIDEDHKTTQNLLKTKAFTVSLADQSMNSLWLWNASWQKWLKQKAFTVSWARS